MSLWLAERPLVLASKSAIRGAILRAAGLPVEVCPADIDERAIEQGSTADNPGAVAALLAREKAHAIAVQLPGRAVLGADQTLALGERRFSKPVDRAAAGEQLKLLRGQTHELHTAIALVCEGTILFEHRDMARLTMRAFSDGFLEDYLDAAGAAVTASVGGYQLEQTGIQLFERVEGDHFVILGLPLLPLLQHLRQAGWLAA
ncbi:MAG: nucleoside triphosphate pyrophosphatase [Alphaproteobacteria bacterium]|jgi:septum formation protein|nr:nucleoside triphosphate pyrophosphatase [Alphaproteobacteria bacterium]